MSQKKIVKKMTAWICSIDPLTEEIIGDLIEAETWKTKKRISPFCKKPIHVDITVIVEPVKPKKKKSKK